MARKAAETGVDGIIVSNYAAKHLDGIPAAVRFTCFLLWKCLHRYRIVTAIRFVRRLTHCPKLRKLCKESVKFTWMEASAAALTFWGLLVWEPKQSLLGDLLCGVWLVTSVVLSLPGQPAYRVCRAFLTCAFLHTGWRWCSRRDVTTSWWLQVCYEAYG